MGGISWGEGGSGWLFLRRLVSKHHVDYCDTQGWKHRRAELPQTRCRGHDVSLTLQVWAGPGNVHSSQALRMSTLLPQGHFKSHWTLPHMPGAHHLLRYHPGLSSREDSPEPSSAVASLPIWWILWTRYIFSSVRSLRLSITQAWGPKQFPVYKVCSHPSPVSGSMPYQVREHS